MFCCGSCGSLQIISPLSNIQRPQPCRRSDRDLCDICRKLESLASRISETNDTLRQLVSEHGELLAERNHSHSPILNRIPTEIISSIFHLSILDSYVPTESGSIGCKIEYNRGDFTPFTLGAVCRVWRNIAWTTPQLWSSITIYLDLDKFPAREELAQQWLLRSGELPLSIRICRSRGYDVVEDEPDLDTRLYPITEVINDYSNRWDHLHLNVPHFLFSAFCGNSYSFNAPILRRLCIDPTTDNYNLDCRFQLRGSKPRPQEVLITYRQLKVVDIGWDNVTSVEATGFHVSDCVELLRRAPQLGYCKLSDVSIHESRAEFPMPTSPFIHKLRRLHFQTSEPSGGTFFVHVSLPCLEYLDCELYEGVADSARLPAFFNRSSCPVRELFIKDAQINDDELIQILKGTPLISRLHLSPLTYDDFTITPQPLFEMLARTPILSSNDVANEEILLPKLEHLEFHLSDDFPWKYLSDTFGSTTDLQDPRRRPLNFLRVVFVREPRHEEDYDSDLCIDQDILHRVLELKKAGIQIEVFHLIEGDIIKSSMEIHGMPQADLTIPGQS